LITIAIYKANVKEITANFCVNKSKPMMHCNGTCHLKKELKEQEKSEKKNPYQNKENRLELNDNMGEVGLSHFFADPHSSLFSSLHYQCIFTSPFISIDSPPPQLIASCALMECKP